MSGLNSIFRSQWTGRKEVVSEPRAVATRSGSLRESKTEPRGKEVQLTGPR